MKRSRRIVTLLLFLAVTVFSYGSSAGSGIGAQRKQYREKDKSEKKVLTGNEGHPVLWKEPAHPESLDLFYGPGGRDGAPDLTRKFTYIGPDTNGTQKKIYVKDDSNREWIVKFGAEARPETVATRIVWAMGYHTDEDYFVRRVHIEGMPGGDAVNVRFKRGRAQGAHGLDE